MIDLRLGLAFMAGFLFALLCIRLLFAFLKHTGGITVRKHGDGSVDIHIC